MLKKVVFAIIISVCVNLIIIGAEMALDLEIVLPARLLIVCPSVVVLTIMKTHHWEEENDG